MLRRKKTTGGRGSNQYGPRGISKRDMATRADARLDPGRVPFSRSIFTRANARLLTHDPRLSLLDKVAAAESPQELLYVLQEVAESESEIVRDFAGSVYMKIVENPHVTPDILTEMAGTIPTDCLFLLGDAPSLPEEAMLTIIERARALDDQKSADLATLRLSGRDDLTVAVVHNLARVSRFMAHALATSPGLPRDAYAEIAGIDAPTDFALAKNPSTPNLVLSKIADHGSSVPAYMAGRTLSERFWDELKRT